MISLRLSARLAVLVCGVVASTVVSATAQPLGVFRWQLLPYCNLVTLSITAKEAVFTLDGFDDQCGAGQRASVVGMAFFNPDGTIGIGLSTVVAPGGAFVHVDARITLSSLGGPWRDSSGNSGTFTFTPGGGVGGPPRPVAPNGIAPGSITTAQLAPGSVTSIQMAPGSVTATQLAPGAVGSAHIDPNQVQTRVTGTCPAGQYLRGIQPNGTALCEPLLTPNVSTTMNVPNAAVGGYNSIAIGADGFAVISHYDSTVKGLRVTHCGNPACTAGNVTTLVDAENNAVGEHSSIAIGVDGLPIISYRDSAAGALRVTHCGNVSCTADNITRNVDDVANSVGLFTAIAIGADGLPIISHFDSTAEDLRVTHCGNVTCTAGNVTTVVDGETTNVGRNTSIAVGADGLPIISYEDRNVILVADIALRVTHCGSVACTADNVSTTIAGPTGVSYTSIERGVDGLPVIASSNAGTGVLYVTHCGNAACTVDNITTLADDPADRVGFFLSMAIGADGLPIISHRNNTTGAVRVTHCGNVSCTAGSVSSTTVDLVGNLFGTTGIAIGVDGLPVISHIDNSSYNGPATLRVTKCATRTCQ